MTVNLNVYGYIKMARTMCDKNGLQLVFENGAQPRTIKNVVYVQQPKVEWTEQQMLEWMYTLCHEIGHNNEVADDSTWMYEQVAPKSFAKSAINISDDTVQESFLIEEGLRGQNSILFNGHNSLRVSVIEQAKKLAGTQGEMAAAYLLWDMGKCRDDRYNLAPIVEAARANLSAKGKEWLDKLEKGNYTDRFHAIEYTNNKKGWEELYKLINDIMQEVFGLKDEESGMNQPQSQDGEGKGDEGDGQDSDSTDGDGDGDGEGDGEDGEGEGETKKGKGKKQKASKVNYEDVLLHKHGAGKRSYAPLTIEYKKEHWMGDSYNYSKEPHVNVHDGSVKHDGTTSAIKSTISSHSLAKVLKRLLLVRSKDRHIYGQKKGRLHNKNVYRATITESGGYQQRVFKVKIENDLLDVAVYVLIDCSGSMGGDKILHAGAAGLLLNEALASLRVPFEITTFTEDGEVSHNVVKPFEKNFTPDQVATGIRNAMENMSGNADGDSILWAYNKLLGRKEKKKVLVVLSDGQPAGYDPRCPAFTKQVIEMIEKGKEVSIYAIGIMYHGVENFYKSYKVINSPAELEDALLGLIRDKLLN